MASDNTSLAALLTACGTLGVVFVSWVNGRRVSASESQKALAEEKKAQAQVTAAQTAAQTSIVTNAQDTDSRTLGYLFQELGRLTSEVKETSARVLVLTAKVEVLETEKIEMLKEHAKAERELTREKAILEDKLREQEITIADLRRDKERGIERIDVLMSVLAVNNISLETKQIDNLPIGEMERRLKRIKDKFEAQFGETP